MVDNKIINEKEIDILEVIKDILGVKYECTNELSSDMKKKIDDMLIIVFEYVFPLM